MWLITFGVADAGGGWLSFIEWLESLGAERRIGIEVRGATAGSWPNDSLSEANECTRSMRGGQRQAD